MLRRFLCWIGLHGEGDYIKQDSQATQYRCRECRQTFWMHDDY